MKYLFTGLFYVGVLFLLMQSLGFAKDISDITMDELVQQTINQLQQDNPYLVKVEKYSNGSVYVLRCDNNKEVRKIKGCM